MICVIVRRKAAFMQTHAKTCILRQAVACLLQDKRIDALAAHPGTAKTPIWDKMDKEKVEGVAFDLTAKVPKDQCIPFAGRLCSS